MWQLKKVPKVLEELMRVLLVGTKARTREKRSKLLRDAGHEAMGVNPTNALIQIRKAETRCLVLGATVPEEIATRLATDFEALGPDRFIVRVAESPTRTEFRYASIVVNPNNPEALLDAVGAVEELRASAQIYTTGNSLITCKHI